MWRNKEAAIIVCTQQGGWRLMAGLYWSYIERERENLKTWLPFIFARYE